MGAGAVRMVRMVRGVRGLFRDVCGGVCWALLEVVMVTLSVMGMAAAMGAMVVLGLLGVFWLEGVVMRAVG